MESIEELKIICQAQKRNKSFLLAFGYTFHRNISIYITKFFLVFLPEISPNSVSFLMIIISLIGGLLLISTDVRIQLLGIVLVYIGFLLDKVDGEIARYKRVFSLRGSYLDEIYHILIPPFLFFCFFFNLIQDNFYLTIILFLSIFFYLLNRYNRKIFLILYLKNFSIIKENLLKVYKNNKIIDKIFNNLFFKIFSIIERFDLFILTIFLIIIFRDPVSEIIKIYFLYIYFVFSLLFFIRWIILNYFGNLDKMINKLKEKGY